MDLTMILALTSGVGAGVVVGFWLATRREKPSTDAEAAARVIAGASNLAEQTKEAYQVVIDEMRKSHATASDAWERERQQAQAFTATAQAHVEVLQQQLLEVVGASGDKTLRLIGGEGDPAETVQSVRERVNRVLATSKNYSEQVGVLTAGGFSSQEAERFIAGDLTDEEIPDLDQRLDRVLSEALMSAPGVV